MTKLPVTRSNPDGSCFKNTTLLPLNLPARRISTVPGVMLALKTKNKSKLISKSCTKDPHKIK
jgi:hypothetical protein